ncbi:uncharacterized protein N7500_008545, partial [Penicillium coprophilum]|uniref:uncharacterized protein n=1 Tax=Penicillium coprophilum TaxID=36646 RepID=UPI002395E6F9
LELSPIVFYFLYPYYPSISRSFFTDQEVRLATERRLKYIRTAKVNISQIQFDPPLPRDLDLKNLERLCGIFRKNRYRRLDIDNYIPTIISQTNLANILRKANIPILSSILIFSILTINKDIGEELRASLVEEYTNQKKPTDREIYRKIRQYKGEDNKAFRERWFTTKETAVSGVLSIDYIWKFWSSLVASSRPSIKKID